MGALSRVGLGPSQIFEREKKRWGRNERVRSTRRRRKRTHSLFIGHLVVRRWKLELLKKNGRDDVADTWAGTCQHVNALMHFQLNPPSIPLLPLSHRGCSSRLSIPDFSRSQKKTPFFSANYAKLFVPVSLEVAN